MKIKLLLFIVLLFLVSCGTKKIAVSSLKEDLNYLERSILEVHPAPFAEIDSVEYANIFENIRNSITKPLNEHQFYIKVAPIVAKLNDGHSETVFPSKTQIKAFLWGSRIPSFDIQIIEDKVYIYDDFSKKKSSIKGMEILEINGQKMNTLLQKMMSFEEGKRMNFRKQRIERSWEREFFENMAYSGDFKLKLKDPKTGEITKCFVKGISQVAFYKRRSKSYSPKGRNKYSEKLKPVILDSTPTSSSIRLKVDSLNSLALINYYGFLGRIDSAAFHETFQYIKRRDIKNLIFDLRFNGGGNTNYFKELLSYFTKDTIMPFSKGILKLSNQYLDDLQLNKDSVLSVYNAKIGDAVCFYRGKDDAIAYNNPLRFEGKLFVLCSDLTFSTASSFSATLKDYGIGTLVGSGPGGLGNSFGDPLPIQLPNSRLLVRISTKKLFRPQLKNGDHIQPDIIIKPTYESVFGNSTPILDMIYNKL
ncbi:MAG: S41 family peptidase [Hyphomicrobiales bacterium]